MRDSAVDKCTGDDPSSMLHRFTLVHETSREIFPTRIMQKPF